MKASTVREECQHTLRPLGNEKQRRERPGPDHAKEIGRWDNYQKRLQSQADEEESGRHRADNRTKSHPKSKGRPPWNTPSHSFAAGSSSVAEDHDSSMESLPPQCETWIEFLAPAFILPLLYCCRHLEREPQDRKSLSLSLSTPAPIPCYVSILKRFFNKIAHAVDNKKYRRKIKQSSSGKKNITERNTQMRFSNCDS